MKARVPFLALFAFLAFPSASRGAEPILLQWGAIDTSAAAPAKSARNVMRKGADAGRAAFLVQFEGAITEEWREWLEGATQVRGYIPANAYLVWATAAEMDAIAAHEGVYWTGEWRKEYKTVRAGTAPAAPAARGAAGANGAAARWMRVGSFLAGPGGAADLRARLEARGATVRSASSRLDGCSAVALLTDAQIDEIAGWADVEWIEPKPTPRLFNDKAVLPNMMDVAPAWQPLSDGGLGLTGAGQTVAVADTGCDLGSLEDVHPDFAGRLLAGYGWWNGSYDPTNSWADADAHGTHVCGSVFGSGALSSGQYRGVAWEANLVAQGCQEDLCGLPDDFRDLLSQAFDAGARIHSDSWGYGTDYAGAYVYDAIDADRFMWTNQNFLAVIAAGNDGIDADTNGVIDPGSVSAPGTSKNCLCVGAAENYRALDDVWGKAWPGDYPADPIKSDTISSTSTPQGLAAFSARGPTLDGRLKPDIVAPGTDVISVRSRVGEDDGWGVVGSNTNYIYEGGTSMATPLTSGSLALVRQWLAERKGMADPPAALMKALLVAGARDMSPGQYGTGEHREIFPRPDRSQGFGHVDLLGSLVPGDDGFLTLVTNRLARTDEAYDTAIHVGIPHAGKYVLALAWQDYPGSSGAAKALVNDLDLSVTTPSGEVLHPNGLDAPDHVNNVELVEFEAAETGAYAVRVRAHEIAKVLPNGGGQPFALVMRGPKTVPGHYAVCVGVNEYKPSYVPADNWLQGCVADATGMRTNLVARGEWTREGATLLLDAAATKAAVRAAITNAAAAAVAGDVFVYTHSSHGYSNEDDSGDPSVDTGICTYDADYEDYELAADLAKFPSGATVVVFVDACHSGGLFKSKRAARARTASAAAPVPFALAERVSAAIDEIRAAEPVRRGGAPRGISSSEIGWITAADYNQYSWDAGPSGGMFTQAAIEGWGTGLCDNAPCGDEDGYADFYELWNYAKDIATGNGPPGTEDYTEAQCFNTNVLLSVRAGWAGEEPPSDVRFVRIPPQAATVGETLRYTLVATNLPGVAGSIAYSVESATAPAGTYSLVGADFAFTPATDGDFSFVFRATNATAGASAKATMSVSAGLTAPDGLFNSGVGDTSFTANWGAVAGAASYLLDVATTNGFGAAPFKPDILSAQPVFGTSHTVNGLIPGTYHWRVRAVGNGPGPFSETEEATLVADPTAPPYILDIGDIEVYLGETAQVRVRVSAHDAAPVTSLMITDGDSAATLSDDGLFSFAPPALGRYAFTIVAVNANGATSVGFSVVAVPRPKKFAVCVGINEYEEISSLEGCVNDAKFMAANLAGRGGWEAANVAVLLNSAATKAAIRGAISNAAARAVAGDTFVYQHSSHGGQFNDLTGDIIHGEDGKATFLCVYDEDYEDNTTAYNDYEIAADLAAFPSGVKVAVLVDACHSGGLFKSREEGRAAAASFDLAARVSARMEADRARRRARGEDVARTLSAAEIGWAVACEYDQTSYDGGFFHSDEWLANPAYGDEYWVSNWVGDEDKGDYHYPSTYRQGGVFTASAAWAWWNGTADTDPEAGDNDGLCDAYEFWKAGYDFCSAVGEYWWAEPDYNYQPQCTNVAVLRSVELGWSGPSAEPFPAVASGATAEDLAAQLAGSADSGLVEHVRDRATYDAFRAWAATAKEASGAAPAGTTAVQASPWAWLAFAIGSDRLLEPGEDDLSIASFSLDPATGAFALEAGLDGAAVADDADPDRLAETFVLDGSESPADAFTPLGIEVESVVPANGKVRFVAAPPDDADAFFLRVRAR